jgi:hypothetical protein
MKTLGFLILYVGVMAALIVAEGVWGVKYPFRDPALTNIQHYSQEYGPLGYIIPAVILYGIVWLINESRENP